MSSEVCPYCGKTYKRLKSHLPHCKAAAGANTPPISREAARTQGSSRFGRLKEEKPTPKLTERQSEKSRTASAASKTKKQKLSEQIRAAVAPPSPAVSPTSRPRSPHPTTSESKETTGHEFFQAAGPQKIIKGAPKRTRAAVENTLAAPSEAQAKVRGEEGSSKMNVSKQKATQAPSLSHNRERTAGACEGNHGWDTTERDLNAHGPKITLQDVKAALGRDRRALKPSRPSVWVHSQSPEPGSRREEEEQWLGTGSASPSKPASTNPPRLHASATPLPPLPPGALSPQVHRAVTGLSAVPPSLGTEALPASVETPGAPDGPNTSASRSEGVLAQQRLAQVRLKELPDWLASKTPTSPRDLVKMVQKGWQWYYRKYIDVRKGGVGGVGMLLAGYCILSYVWSYPHLSKCATHACNTNGRVRLFCVVSRARSLEEVPLKKGFTIPAEPVSPVTHTHTHTHTHT